MTAYVSALLATDLQGSVFQRHTDKAALSYTAFGYCPIIDGQAGSLKFNAQLCERSNLYLLGNGYRAFHTALMRFGSMDTLSPFGKGGVNAYAYCGNDPVNRADPTGHMFKPSRSPSTLTSPPAYSSLGAIQPAQLDQPGPSIRLPDFLAGLPPPRYSNMEHELHPRAMSHIDRPPEYSSTLPEGHTVLTIPQTVHAADNRRLQPRNGLTWSVSEVVARFEQNASRQPEQHSRAPARNGSFAWSVSRTVAIFESRHQQPQNGNSQVRGD